jgi:hypothetical protein
MCAATSAAPAKPGTGLSGLEGELEKMLIISIVISATSRKVNGFRLGCYS